MENSASNEKYRIRPAVESDKVALRKLLEEEVWLYPFLDDTYDKLFEISYLDPKHYSMVEDAVSGEFLGYLEYTLEENSAEIAVRMKEEISTEDISALIGLVYHIPSDVKAKQAVVRVNLNE